MTMHKLESVEKLLHQYEETEIPDPFVYADFNYQLKEFDNIPEVIPRFAFYLQSYLRPIVAHAKYIKDGLQPEVLRQEMLKLDKQ
jgi:hypothetical protein